MIALFPTSLLLPLFAIFAFFSSLLYLSLALCASWPIFTFFFIHFSIPVRYLCTLCGLKCPFLPQFFFLLPLYPHCFLFPTCSLNYLSNFIPHYLRSLLSFLSCPSILPLCPFCPFFCSFCPFWPFSFLPFLQKYA